MRRVIKVVSVLFFVLIGSPISADQIVSEDPEVGPFVEWLLEDEGRLEEVRFAVVSEAVSGKQVIAVDPLSEVDEALLIHLQESLNTMLEAFEDPAHPIHSVGRVNEISRYVEDSLLERLNAGEGFECTIPVNASGDRQRSGYPDLRLVHSASGRVFYLDPKVFKEGSERSSFRSFYFEPKGATNKILDDASHLIIGIAHSGRVNGRWHLNEWKIVDLIDFRVRLKAEFQSSNRELYKASSILMKSRK